MRDALGSAGWAIQMSPPGKRGTNLMKSLNGILVALALGITLACTTNTKAPDVTDNVRHALDSAGLTDVHVSQDRDKNVVTLTGNVATDDDKGRAESIARSNAGSAVIADEIGVRPKGDESTAKKVDSDLDSGIDKNLEAMLVEHKMNRAIRYDVNNGVVTLKGDVPSQGQRANVEKLAQQVPNVKQVVNELEVKNQRATSTK
jgi:hyperosmotically inducible periplasmic protein